MPYNFQHLYFFMGRNHYWVHLEWAERCLFSRSTLISCLFPIHDNPTCHQTTQVAGNSLEETNTTKASRVLLLGSGMVVALLCQILRARAIETGFHRRTETALLSSVSWTDRADRFHSIVFTLAHSRAPGSVSFVSKSSLVDLESASSDRVSVKSRSHGCCTWRFEVILGSNAT